MDNSQVKSEVSKLIQSPNEMQGDSTTHPDIQSPAGNKSSSSGWSGGKMKKDNT